MTSKEDMYEKGKCPRCGIDIIADIPFIDGEIHGYKSVDHGCGENVTMVVMKAPSIAALFFEED